MTCQFGVCVAYKCKVMLYTSVKNVPTDWEDLQKYKEIKTDGKKSIWFLSSFGNPTEKQPKLKLEYRVLC